MLKLGSPGSSSCSNSHTTTFKNPPIGFITKTSTAAALALAVSVDGAQLDPLAGVSNVSVLGASLDGGDACPPSEYKGTRFLRAAGAWYVHDRRMRLSSNTIDAPVPPPPPTLPRPAPTPPPLPHRTA